MYGLLHGSMDVHGASLIKGCLSVSSCLKEGGFAGATTIDLVRNTKSPKEARQYINLVMDPLPQLGQANEIPYGPTNRLLAPILAANPSLAQKFPSSPEDFRKLYVVNWEVYNKNFSRVNSLWNRRILSR